jgi:hypothetical protein
MPKTMERIDWSGRAVVAGLREERRKLRARQAARQQRRVSRVDWFGSFRMAWIFALFSSLDALQSFSRMAVAFFDAVGASIRRAASLPARAAGQTQRGAPPPGFPAASASAFSLLFGSSRAFFLIVALASFFGSSCALVAQSRALGDPQGWVWVRWPQWSAQLATPSSADLPRPLGGAQPFVQRQRQEKAQRRLRAWDASLSGGSEQTWRGAQHAHWSVFDDVGDSATCLPGARECALPASGPLSLSAACFQAGACERLRASALQSFWALLSGRPVLWSAMEGGQARARAADLAAIGDAAPKMSWRAAVAGVSCALVAGVWLVGLWVLFRKSRAFAPQAPARFAAIAAGLALETIAPICAAVSSAIVFVFFFCAVFFHADERFLVSAWPASADTRLMGLELGDVAQWELDNDWGLVVAGVPDMVARSEPPSAEAMRKAALARCEERNYCAFVASSGFGDYFRAFFGLPARARIQAFPSGASASERQILAAWARAARETQTAGVVGLAIGLSFLVWFLGGLVCVTIGMDATDANARRVLAWAEKGGPLEESRILSRAVFSAPPASASPGSQKGGSQNGAVRKKPARL